jgi:FAD:protein FMN transferase
MAQPQLVDSPTAAPARRSRRDFLSGTRARRADADYWIRVHRRAMACEFEITLASDDAGWVPSARAALNEIDRLEDQLSLFRDDSTISDINRRAAAVPVDVEPHLFDLLQHSIELHRETDGAFDITATPLSRCWGFLKREGRVPAPEVIAAARAVVGADAVALDPARRSIRFARAGVELNLGAIGKGYALDRAAKDMRAAGVSHALLSAGRSSLLAIGGRKRGWQVEVVSPRARQPLATVWLRNAAFGTSGAGEQFIDVDARYGHVIDPRTGWPASGVLSVSVAASSAAAADALSTAFFVGGLDLATRYCAGHPEVLALVTVDDGSERPVVIGKHSGVSVL